MFSGQRCSPLCASGSLQTIPPTGQLILLNKRIFKLRETKKDRGNMKIEKCQCPLLQRQLCHLRPVFTRVTWNPSSPVRSSQVLPRSAISETILTLSLPRLLNHPHLWLLVSPGGFSQFGFPFSSICLINSFLSSTETWPNFCLRVGRICEF